MPENNILVQQVADLHQRALSRMPRTVVLELRPPDMGRVALRLSLTGDGLQAHLQVSHPAVKAALEANLDDLEHRLHQQGLNLAGFAVSVGDSATGQAGSHPDADLWQHRQDHPGTQHPQPLAPTLTPAPSRPAPDALVGLYLDQSA